jgi:hypothetical protein
MKKIQNISVIMTMASLLVFVSGCSGKQASTIPPALAALAQQFRQASPENRVELGKKIKDALPTCMSQAAGNMATVDIANPSYKLFFNDVIALLGEPSERNAAEGYVVYDLGRDAKAKWFLMVEFNGDYVTAGRIDVANRK